MSTTVCAAGVDNRDCFFVMMGPSLSIEDHYEEANKWSSIIFANRLTELVRTTLNWTQ